MLDESENLFCLPSRAEDRGLPASGRDCRQPGRNSGRPTRPVYGEVRRSRFPQQPAMRAHSPAAAVGPAAGPTAQ